MFNFSIAAIFKNEGPYILEWIAAHKALGVDHFFIANNGSVDGSDELLRALSDIGVITYFDFEVPVDISPQIPCYEYIVKRFGCKSKWIAFIDADEIIFPTENHISLVDYIDSIDSDDLGILALNWSIFGSSDEEYYKNEFVVERFKKRANRDFGINRHYKPILKADAFYSMCGTTHDFNLKDGYKIRHIDGSDLSYRPQRRGVSDKMIWSPFRLNHYLLKSKEEFTLRKSRNGDAAVLGRSKGRGYFLKHDKNDVFDDLSEKYLGCLKSEHSKLMEKLNQKKFVYPGFSSIFDKKSSLQWLGKGIPIGFLDNFSLDGGRCKFYGWSAALGFGGVRRISFVVDGYEFPVDYFQLQRKDVIKVYNFLDLNCGFCVSMEKSYFLEIFSGRSLDVVSLKIYHHDGSDIIDMSKKLPFFVDFKNILK